MYIAYLDEFGHVGPFVSRHHPEHQSSPVFGLSGFVMPASRVRSFGTWFFRQKQFLFTQEQEASRHHPATWEKKGSEFFTQGKIANRPWVRQTGFRLINQILKHNGVLFHVGMEKFRPPETANPTGLYRTVLAESMRRLDSFAHKRDEADLLIVLDEHSGRLRLIETCLKTMFGQDRPARHLAEAPYQVESHLYQTVQAADWLATLTGRLWTYRVRPEEYADYAWAETYFGKRLDAAARHSTFRCRPGPAQGLLPV